MNNNNNNNIINKHSFGKSPTSVHYVSVLNAQTGIRKEREGRRQAEITFVTIQLISCINYLILFIMKTILHMQIKSQGVWPIPRLSTKTMSQVGQCGMTVVYPAV